MAWFVLYLDLPGVLTPIVWLAGFLLPLVLFKVFQSCPRCTCACFAQQLIPPGMHIYIYIKYTFNNCYSQQI